MGFQVHTSPATRTIRTPRRAARHGRASRGAAAPRGGEPATGGTSATSWGTADYTSFRVEIYRRMLEEDSWNRSERSPVEEPVATYYKRAITLAMQHKCRAALRGLRTHPHSEPVL